MRNRNLVAPSQKTSHTYPPQSSITRRNFGPPSRHPRPSSEPLRPRNHHLLKASVRARQDFVHRVFVMCAAIKCTMMGFQDGLERAEGPIRSRGQRPGGAASSPAKELMSIEAPRSAARLPVVVLEHQDGDRWWPW